MKQKIEVIIYAGDGGILIQDITYEAVESSRPVLRYPTTGELLLMTTQLGIALDLQKQRNNKP